MNRWQFWIDVGGTFTDCIAQSPTGELTAWKSLSSGRIKGRLDVPPESNSFFDPHRQGVPRDFWKGWQLTIHGETAESPAWKTRVTGSSLNGTIFFEDAVPSPFTGLSYELHSHESAPLVCIRHVLQLRLDEAVPPVDVRMGTTRGTNALLERKGAKTAFLTTRGFEDSLLIGNQDRPELFALEIQKPEPLTRIAVGIEERMAADGRILVPLNASAALEQLRELKEQGIISIAICLLHAYRNSQHEEQLETLAREAGFTEISRSSQVAPVIKLVPRAETTVLDAYLTPGLRESLKAIRQSLGPGSQLKVMSSHGGLVDAAEFSGRDSILSGPAGGVIASTRIAGQAGFRNSIGFDMGGTSTDVSRYGGRYELESETVKAGVRIASSVLAIETVAAGGGSICQFDGVQLRVGPESAGADPGPACYGRGGPLTVTDMNVMLGRVLPTHFPFPLDVTAIHRQLDEMREKIRRNSGTDFTRESLSQGYLDIANETMAQAIRRISVRKGYDPADHVLVCFGGAGGQHACALARILNIGSILIHPFAGLLSALGMGLADVRRRAEQTVLKELSGETLKELEPLFADIAERLKSEVQSEGIPVERIAPATRSLSLRYRGVESTISIEHPADGDYRRQFEIRHQQLYGYLHPQRPLEIAGLAVEVTGQLERPHSPQLPLADQPLQPTARTQTWFAGESCATAVYRREQLRAGHLLAGPSIVCDAGSTNWIEPGFQAQVQETGCLLLTRMQEKLPEKAEVVSLREDAAPDPVTLELFNNRFASIAEQMGVTLRRTSVSTNVKERLDYSCALFDADGGLVVNAPHIPVHLGAMGETIRCLLRDNPAMAPGDVFLTNDPYAGGSHLPDLTVVTPVHDAETGKLLFLTASRAHHAEIGGLTPGSMPPFSKNLGEEGVLISNFTLVDAGTSRINDLLALLTCGPWPSRNPHDNLADVSAQMAANRVGSQLLTELVEEFTSDRVQRAMAFVQAAAEFKMRRALERLPDGEYARTDSLDDGSPIAVRVTIRGASATVDFTGTGPVLSTNLNANRAIVTAAVMYVFRCLIDEPIPLNSGVLRPLELILPECLLNPPVLADRSRCAAMVGGNVETSQRVVDVLLGALELAAASQGTMNNLTFGNESFGYYETLCGGAGATPNAAGADAVHTHMTNTRLTDVEVFESRYPALIQEFSIRQGSGGRGIHAGGNGVRREFEFLQPLKLSLLTQRRGPFPPFGLKGGEPGELGVNLLQRGGSGTTHSIGGTIHLEVHPGDRLTILTPGGGGWGTADLE